MATDLWAPSPKLARAVARFPSPEAHAEQHARLKPGTHYVCPTGGGYGHSSVYTGAHNPVFTRPGDHRCMCGEEFVEEDRETWRLTFESPDPWSGDWHPVTVTRSRHAAHEQHRGLLELQEQGQVRNVQLVQVRVTVEEVL